MCCSLGSPTPHSTGLSLGGGESRPCTRGELPHLQLSERNASINDPALLGGKDFPDGQLSGRLHELCETLFVVCMWPGGGGRGARLERPRVGASGPRGINASRLAFSRLAASFSHTVAEAATYLARFLGFYSASMSIREASPSTHVVSPQTIRLVPTGKPQAAAICLYATYAC